MRIALLATGGTIACRQTPDGLSPALHAEELAKSISCRDGVTLLPVDVFSMDSSNIQPEEWTQLAHAVDRAMQDCDGVVITHGTDTMGYTAAALSYMLLGQMKPVILTGSQLPLGAPLSDAEINLSCAIEAASQGVAGTYVCFNRKLILGTRAVKTHTLSFDAFDSVNRSLSGMVDSTSCVRRRLTRRTSSVRRLTAACSCSSSSPVRSPMCWILSHRRAIADW